MHNWTKQGTPILKMYPIYVAYAEFNKKSQKSPALSLIGNVIMYHISVENFERKHFILR